MLKLALAAIAAQIATSGLTAPDADTVPATAAPAEIVVYTAMICEDCGAWYRDQYPRIADELLKTGLAELTFVNVLAPPVEYTAPAGAVVICTPGDRRNAVVDKLLSTEAQVRTDELALTPWLQAAVVESGMTWTEMSDCVSSQVTRDALNSQHESAIEAGVDQVPRVTVDGIRILEPTAANLRAVVASRNVD